MKLFKIRCSAIGQIMTNARGSGLSKTCQSYVDTWVKEQIYNRKKTFSSKYTQKGIIMEDNSLDFIADQLDYGMLLKNEESFENDFLTGTPDNVQPDHVIDTKNPWDPFTFPLFETEPDKSYWWQGQGYMELTGKDKYKLIYTLSDTPANLIQKEAYYYAKDNGYDELSEDIYEQFESKMTYPDIEDKYKIKVFEFEKDPEAIAKIIDRVLEIRNYIQSLNII